MKTAVLITLLPSVALSFPLSIPNIFSRQTAALNAATDRLMFSTSLSGFISARNAQNPAGLDWSSDGCSSSPDNPFGFPFEPACYRHDFGYRNFKKQNRFSDANKLRIDNNFKTDLYNQCAGQTHDSTCRATADVYYAAVREFGREIVEAKIDAESE